MTSRILVTGATGFVGGWLLDSLARSQPGASLFGSMRSQTIPTFIPPSVTLLHCDITDEAQIQRLVEKARPDFVYHMAGFSSAIGGDYQTVHQANVDATRVLLRALCRQNKPCRVLLASSGYVYGAPVNGQLSLETDPLHPAGLYGESKAAMETEAQAFLESDPAADLLAITVVRAFNHTGARQNADFVVPAFARQIAAIEAGLESPIVSVGNLEARRDFLDVRDVVRAYQLLMETVPRVPLRTVNVSSGIPITIQSLLEELIELSTASLTVETDPKRLRPADLSESAGDNTLLRTLTNWEPKIARTQMLEDTLNCWRTEIAAHGNR